MLHILLVSVNVVFIIQRRVYKLINQNTAFVKSTTLDASIVDALLKAGLPLSSQEIGDTDGDGSKIVCIAELTEGRIKSVIVTPSRSIFESNMPIESEILDADEFAWNFAARNYYWVTGNMEDRAEVARLCRVDTGVIKGRCLSRGKSEDLSGMDLAALLLGLGCKKTVNPVVEQGSLF